MRRMLLFGAVAAVAIAAPAAAQTAPAVPPSPNAPSMAPAMRTPDAAMPLRMAYYTIGHAEQAGASGRFLDAARTHYRGAIDRNARNDAAGAAAEARLAADLAHVAIAERGRNAMPAPRDLPAPPSPRPRPSGMLGGMRGPGGFDGMMRGGPDGMMQGPDGMMHGPDGMMHGRPGGMMRMHGGRDGFGGGFSATRLAEVLKTETGAEARGFAQAAVDADAAAQRAALAGNVDEAARQSHVAAALMRAVEDVARLNHPPSAPRAMRRPLG